MLDVIRSLPLLTAEDCYDQTKVESWLAQLAERLQRSPVKGSTYETEVFTKDAGGELGIKVTINMHGVESVNILTADFFASREYDHLTRLERQFQLRDAVIQRGDKDKPVGSLKEAFDWLLEQAASGVNLQRYKGLGEMNPDQLWETTMDASSRNLLIVKIEDAVAADEIFTTLMGDQVEPRREFIEQNALIAENLDT